MLPTKELKDVFKDAQTVTSLGSEALVVCDSNGVTTKTSKATLFSEINDFGVNLVPGSLKKLVSSCAVFPVPAGTPVVMSFESYEPTQGPGGTSFLVVNGPAEDGSGTYTEVAVDTPLSLVSQGFIRLYTSSSGWTANKGYFHKLKLEKGYSASKWSPAPEDLISLLGGG